MAEQYLTIEQACEFLSKTADELSAMVADGRLTEVRDGSNIFFKKSELEQIAAKEGSSIVDLAMTDEADAQDTETFASALSSLVDEGSGLGLLDQSPGAEDILEANSAPAAKGSFAEIELEAGSPGAAELSLENLPEELPAAPKTGDLAAELDLGAPGEAGLGSPQEIPDLGLSGSSILGLEPSAPKAAAPEKPADKGGAKPGKVGISVFDDEEIEASVDPMGETRISAGVPELDTVGSGSGLLDLTRESDDTSLGAELLDVISPTDAAETQTAAEDEGIQVVGAEETVEDSGPEMTAVEAEEDRAEPVLATMSAGPRVAVAAMRGAVPLNVCALIGILAMAVLGLATAGALQGVWPQLLGYIAKDVVHYAVFGGLALAAIVTGVLSIMADRSK